MRFSLRGAPCRVLRRRHRLLHYGYHEEGEDENRRHEAPQDLPVWTGSEMVCMRANYHCILSPSLFIIPVTSHLLDVVGEPPVSVDVHDGDDFDEGDEREAHGGVAVEEGEPVLPGPSREEQPA